jgi:1,2-diacylglycerol 3-alpha-glucosyltransferase
MVSVSEQVPDALLLVAGEGPALAHCKRLAVELGLQEQTLFVGYLDRKHELLDCYRAGDLFAFASRTETQGLVLLEAMAQGVPVVSTAHMGTLDILGSRRGCVVVEESEADFAAAVVGLLRDRARREALGAEARTYAATWSAREMATRLIDLYRVTLAGRAGSVLAPVGHQS